MALSRDSFESDELFEASDDTLMSSSSSSATSLSSQPKKKKKSNSSKRRHAADSDSDYNPDSDIESEPEYDAQPSTNAFHKAASQKARKTTSKSDNRLFEVFCESRPRIKNLKDFLTSFDAELKKIKDSNPKDLDILFDVTKNLIAFMAAVKKDRDNKVKGLDSRKSANPLQELSEHKINAPFALQLFNELETFYRIPFNSFTSHSASSIKGIILTLSQMLSKHQSRSLMDELRAININTYTYKRKKVFRPTHIGEGYILNNLDFIANNPNLASATSPKKAIKQKSADKTDMRSDDRPAKRPRTDSNSTVSTDAKTTTANLINRFQGGSHPPSQPLVAGHSQTLQQPAVSHTQPLQGPILSALSETKETKVMIDVKDDRFLYQLATQFILDINSYNTLGAMIFLQKFDSQFQKEPHLHAETNLTFDIKNEKNLKWLANEFVLNDEAYVKLRKFYGMLTIHHLQQQGALPNQQPLGQYSTPSFGYR